MSAELDLTAAIESGAESLGTNHEFRVHVPEFLPYCICGWRAIESHDVAAYDAHVAVLVIEAALPHIRQQLAQQASHEPTQEQHKADMASTYRGRWELNSRVESDRILWEAGYRSGRDATARIVRGLP